MIAFFLGFALGFFGSVPAAGPPALAIVGTALSGRAVKALRMTVAAALAEAGWAALALTSVNMLDWQRLGALPALRVAGALIVALLGVSMLRTPGNSPSEVKSSRLSALSDFALGFTLVATYPGMLVAWTGSSIVVAGLPPFARQPTWAIVAGAFFGVCTWFTLMTMWLSRVQARFDSSKVLVVRRGVALLIIASGLWLGASAL